MHEHDQRPDWKTSFNITHNGCLIHQRGVLLPFRSHWGKNALGMPCGLALVLMLLWAAFSQDPFMYIWITVWMCFYLRRRAEALKLNEAGTVHTYSDGLPNNLGSDVNKAKLIYEPAMVFAFGLLLREIYLDNGWPTGGLPAFFLTGVITLPMVELVKKKTWERRRDAINDARHEQDGLSQM